MKHKILRGLIYVAIGYLLLVGVHFLYLLLGGDSTEYRLYKGAAEERAMNLSIPMVAQDSRIRNYATAKYRAEAREHGVEQKYEKIGSLVTTSTAFEADERRAREEVKLHGALVQEEMTNAHGKRRELRLTLGVPPDNFDAVVAKLKTIGKLQDLQVTKSDKTNSFLELRAKRQALEKTRDALVALKRQGGKIDEFIKLEQEILGIEGKIQALGVELGHFDQVNEFCTVRFHLQEVEATSNEEQTDYFGMVLRSLAWASTVYLALLGAAFVGLLCVVLVLVIVERLRLFRMEDPGRDAR